MKLVAGERLYVACLVTVAAMLSMGPRCIDPPTIAVEQVNLVSDQPGVAAVTDPNLVNAWGLAFRPDSPFWVADNGTGVSTLYDPDGTPRSLVVTIPPPEGSPPGTVSAPTGLVDNEGSGFVVTENGKSGPARFIWVTEDGTIAGWNPDVNPTVAVIMVDNSPEEAIYKGVTIYQKPGTGEQTLYATDFHNNKIDVFDSEFQPVTLPAGAFTDPTLPAGYAPFNVKALNNRIYVTYALQDENAEDDVPGPGHGFVDIFKPDGDFVRRLISQGPLDSPWGMALVPGGFKQLSSALLIGNFGDGHITAVNPNSGAVLGQLTDVDGNPIVIDGLWSLLFRGATDTPNRGQSGSQAHDESAKLFFTAGPDGEKHGLFGFLQVVE